MPAPNYIPAAHYKSLCAIVDTALTALYAGTATDEHRDNLAAAINYAWAIAESVQRHNHLIPDIAAANQAALGGWHDVAVIDTCVQIYKALLLATPRKTVARVMRRMVA